MQMQLIIYASVEGTNLSAVVIPVFFLFLSLIEGQHVHRAQVSK